LAPGAVLTGTNSRTGNHKSTGSVDVALYRAGSATARVGGPAVALPVAVVTSTSSASATQSDHYGTTVTITLKIKDSASRVTGTFNFKATLSGTLSAKGSSLTLTFQGPLSRQLKLGARTYTVTLKTGALKVPAPGKTPALIGATVQVR
jgi:hypothetical protein